ncbi:MAG TPA: hypothetical protein VNP73_04210 [Actinomycetota bacterium]|nr:hypothetical protein [Actinomycetota bacterium]
MLRIAPLLVALLLAAGCGNSDGPASTRSACPEPTPVTSKIPKDLPFEDWGTVTKVERDERFLIVQVDSEQSVVELHPQIARALLGAGYEIVGADNEGFESEIFFAPGKGLTGLFRLRQSPCKGRVIVTLLYEPESR